MVLYLANSAELALGRENTGWLGFWTVFYWGWFWPPRSCRLLLLGIRGRTELTLAVAVLHLYSPISGSAF